jgi:hypothetical protein
VTILATSDHEGAVQYLGASADSRRMAWRAVAHLWPASGGGDSAQAEAASRGAPGFAGPLNVRDTVNRARDQTNRTNKRCFCRFCGCQDLPIREYCSQAFGGHCRWVRIVFGFLKSVMA